MDIPTMELEWPECIAFTIYQNLNIRSILWLLLYLVKFPEIKVSSTCLYVPRTAEVSRIVSPICVRMRLRRPKKSRPYQSFWQDACEIKNTKEKGKSHYTYT